MTMARYALCQKADAFTIAPGGYNKTTRGISPGATLEKLPGFFGAVPAVEGCGRSDPPVAFDNAYSAWCAHLTLPFFALQRIAPTPLGVPTSAFHSLLHIAFAVHLSAERVKCIRCLRSRWSPTACALRQRAPLLQCLGHLCHSS